MSTTATHGLDDDYRDQFNTTRATYVRHFGLTAAAAIIAAHGGTL